VPVHIDVYHLVVSVDDLDRCARIQPLGMFAKVIVSTIFSIRSQILCCQE
jgi:hypothetical protein